MIEAVRAHRLRLACLAAALAAVVGLHACLQGWWWALQALLAVVVVLGVGALARRRPVGVAVAAQVVAAVVLVTVLFAPGQAVLGLLPGPAALGQLHALVDAAQVAVVQDVPPAPAVPALRLLTTSGAALLALVLDLLVVRAHRPALAGLPLLAVHVVAVVLAPDGLGWVWFALAAGGYALLLGTDAADRTARWGRTVRPMAGVGRPARAALTPQVGVVLAVLVAVAAPVVAPATGALHRPGSGGAGADAVDPLIDLRSDLHSRSSTSVLTYRTSLASPQPLRIVTVDTFDGQVWRPTRDASTQHRLTRDLPAAPGLSAGTPTHAERETISITRLRQQFLPLPYPSTSVDVDGDWDYDERTLNVAGAGGTTTSPGQSYSVKYLQVVPTWQQLSGAARPPASVVEAYGVAPSDLPPSIAATARSVVGSATTEYAQAVALQDWFRATGGFTYSTSAPPPRSASALADFLRAKKGYCVHFASAMAVMARTLGIPARVAVGFLPGSQQADGRWTITLQDAHAWPELYFAGAGWVRFEPTPAERTGVAPDWTTPTAATLTPEGGTSGVVPSTAPTATGPSAHRDSTAGSAGGSSTRTSSGTGHLAEVIAAAGAAVVVLAVLALPALAAAGARRRRRRRARGPGERAEAAWADLVEQAGDLGIDVPPSATPRSVGRLLGVGGGGVGAGGTGGDAPVGQALERLVGAVEAARYAPASSRGGVLLAPPGGGTSGGGVDLAGDARTVVRVLAARRPRATRWRGRLFPDSGRSRLSAPLSRRTGRG